MTSNNSVILTFVWVYKLMSSTRKDGMTARPPLLYLPVSPSLLFEAKVI